MKILKLRNLLIGLGLLICKVNINSQQIANDTLDKITNNYSLDHYIRNNPDALSQYSERELKIYNRWDWYLKRRVDNTGSMRTFIRSINKLSKESSANATFEKPAMKSLPQNYVWDTIGPDVAYGSKAMRGRFTSIWVDEDDNNYILAGSNSAGLWRTTDGGGHWVRITEDYITGGISGIAVDPNNKNVIYIVTRMGVNGLFKSLRSTQYNLGIWKTINGSKTNPDVEWTRLNTDRIPTDEVFEKILIHPTNSSILYALTRYGVYKTTNSGQDWNPTNLILYGADYVYFTDMKFKPNDPTTIYVSGRNTLYRLVNSGAYKYPLSISSAFSDKAFSIAVKQSAPNNLYVNILEADTSNLEEFWKSTDSGNSFSKTGTWDRGVRGAVFHCFQACMSPTGKIYVGGVDFYRSDNEGSTFISTFSNPSHDDIRDYCFPNAGSGLLYVATDGGILKTSNDGASWTKINGNLIGHEFYDIAISQTADYYAGGAHDNGTCSYSSYYGWFYVSGGDGGTTLKNHDGTSDLYYTVNKRFYRGGSPNTLLCYLDYYDSPVVMDPTDVDVLYKSEDINDYQIQRSTAAGNPGTWVSVATVPNSMTDMSIPFIDPDVAFFTTKNSWSDSRIFYTTDNWSSVKEASYTGLENVIDDVAISSIKVNPYNSQEVFITFLSFNNDKVFITQNGGQTWNNITGTGLPDLPVTCLEYDYLNKVVFVGTDIGLYAKYIADDQWERAGDFPYAIVSDIELGKYTGNLAVATYGLGIFKTNLGNGYCQKSAVVTTINTNTVWNSNTSVCVDVEIESGSTLTVSAEITMGVDCSITVKNGATLIIDSGLLKNANIIVNSGGTLTFEDGGSAICNTGSIEVANGGIHNLLDGEIITNITAL
ncbi:MAG: hypothetical protein K9J30_09465 [Bacteroidales bacterium]|nr:hypothetical protein [Bacteroidales bacterium]